MERFLPERGEPIPMSDEAVALRKANPLDVVEQVRDEIGQALQRYDHSNPDKQARSLFAVWEQCVKFQDTNDLILQHIYQLHVLLQSHYDDFLSEKTRIWKEIKDLEDSGGSGEEMDKHRKNLYALVDAHNRLILSTEKVILNAAKEHRNANFQSRFVFPVNQVNMMLGALMSAIAQAVNDPAVVKQIMDKIKVYTVVLKAPEEAKEM